MIEKFDLTQMLKEIHRANTIETSTKVVLDKIADIQPALQNGQKNGFEVGIEKELFENINFDGKWINVSEIFSQEKNSIDEEKRLLMWHDTASKFMSSFRENPGILNLCINSTGKKVEFLVNHASDNGALEENLRGFYPGITYIKKNNIKSDYFKRAWVGGIPTFNKEHTKSPIDMLLSSMYGDKFIYLLSQRPLRKSEIENALDKLSKLLDPLKTLNEGNYSLPSGQQHSSRFDFKFGLEILGQLVEFLETDIKRYREGLLQGMWETRICLQTNDDKTLSKGSSLITSIFGGEESIPMRLQVRDESFVSFLTSSEIATYFSLPTKEFPGITIKPLYSFGSNAEAVADGIAVGEILHDMQPTGNNFSIALNVLTKHAFITGTTGAGKTTTVKNILGELGRNKIPFLVIEPAKSEYKEFIKSIGGNYIEVGKDDFSINLFEPIKGTPVITHIDYLRAVFSASFVLYPPMPYILETAIYDAYKKCHFTFDDNKDERLVDFPKLKEFPSTLEGIVQEAGYTAEMGNNIKASLKVRFENLLKGYKGKIFGSDKTTSFSDIMKKPTVICLKNVVDDEQKALLMSLLLTYLYEYCESRGKSNNELRHVTIVEEAHRLLARTASMDGNPEAANPKARAVEFFANLLAEIRVYGEGLIIAEQIPTKLIPDVIKNTGTKIVHNLVSYDDKEVMAKAMNFEEGQERFLTILKPGQAVVFSENTVKPVVVKVGKGDRKNG